MKNHLSNNRRKFLRDVSLGALATIALPDILSVSAASQVPQKQIFLEKDDVILFQGDSITDWGRDKVTTVANDFGMLGSGYVLVTGATLVSKHPVKNLHIFNRGISGNKVFQLAERWDADCLDLKPNVLSIMIGVNDYWHTITSGYKGTIDTYRDDYKKLLTRTKQALPNVKLIIIEPFAVKGVKAVDDTWYPAFDSYRQAAKEVATQFDAVFIPMQSIFDKALEVAPGNYWTLDGVHPSAAGAGLMAHAWLEAVTG
jgi:lysophospholipase L1-like esterase